MGWSVVSQLVLYATKGGRALAVSVEPSRLVIAALETDIEPGIGDLESTEAVLNRHAHRVVGIAKNLSHAMKMAEAFAKDWRSGNPLDRCSCGSSLKSAL